MKRSVGIFLVLLAMILNACSLASSNLTLNQSTDVTPPPAPENGKATVIGRALSSKNGAPIAKTIIRLAEVHREQGTAVFVLDNGFSPVAISDAKGYFIFSNVPAGEYVVTVGEFFSNWKAYEEDGKPKVFNAEADKILDVKQIKVDLTQ